MMRYLPVKSQRIPQYVTELYALTPVAPQCRIQMHLKSLQIRVVQCAMKISVFTLTVISPELGIRMFRTISSLATLRGYKDRLIFRIA